MKIKDFFLEVRLLNAMLAEKKYRAELVGWGFDGNDLNELKGELENIILRINQLHWEKGITEESAKVFPPSADNSYVTREERGKS